MCGIFGAINISGFFNGEDHKTFVAQTDVVNYRGPDSSGYQVYNSKVEDDQDKFDIFLGHRRLSIIDLSEAGNQPMTFDEVSVVFNGEIFNYIELRKELEKGGADFKTDTDTEVIIRTYLKFGEQGFTNFNGMWAFILYDNRNKRIIVSRDRFSIKPLYYLIQKGNYYFASELKQLTPLLSHKEINRKTFYHFFNQSLLDHSDETFLQNIFKVKASHNLVVDLNKKEHYQQRYWNYNVSINLENVTDVFEQFRSLFIDSVKIRLRSDVKVGSLLSGGLDSSAITVIADQLSSGMLESFSVVADDKKYSEEKYVDIVCNRNNIKNKKLSFNPEMILNRLDEVIYHQDEPFVGFSVVAQYLIFEKIKKETDVTVILSGQGGDEVLMGYLKYFFFNLKYNLNKGDYKEVGKQLLFSLWHRTVLQQFEFGNAKRYMSFMMKKPASYLKGSWAPVDTWSFKNLTERQALDIDHLSVPALAHYEDRNSMAFSIESRLPFLDHRLVEFCLNVPASLKIKNGWTKYILRKSIMELPEEIRWRRDKKGFITPEEKWLRNELKPLLKNTMEKSLLDAWGVIDKKQFLRTYEGFLNNSLNIHYTEISRVLIAELWLKKIYNE